MDGEVVGEGRASHAKTARRQAAIDALENAFADRPRREWCLYST